MNDLEQWKQDLENYYRNLFFMDPKHKDDWQEAARQAAESQYQAELLKRQTSVNLPEVTVTASNPTKTVVTESDWDPGYTKFMSGERYYADQDHKNYLDWLRNDYTRGIREATDKWGNAIGAGVEIASGFTPLWWVAPAVRTGLDLSEGNYKGAALNAGLAFAAPYAVGKAFLYGDDLYRGYKSMTDPKNVYEVMAEGMAPVKTSSAGMWTNRGTRSAKISEAERLGIPKGIKYYTQEENLAFRNQINNFAKKYGYEPIGDEVTDPEVLERYARSLIKRHNTFYRGVELNPKESNLSLEYMATHAPGEGAGELYITPYLSVAAMYGEPVEILRPYKLGADRTRWFDEGDFPIYTAGGRRDMHLWEDKKGIAAPWLRSEEFAGKESWVYKPHVETELTGRNLQFIPISVLYRNIHPHLLPVYRVGSLAVPNTPFYKSGGKLNYLNLMNHGNNNS